MKKILYILLAHVIVLGSLWVWRDMKDRDSLAVLNEYQQAANLIFIKKGSTGTEMLICIDRVELEDAYPGQMFNAVIVSETYEMKTCLPDLREKDSYSCYNILLNESDPECSDPAEKGDDDN